MFALWRPLAPLDAVRFKPEAGCAHRPVPFASPATVVPAHIFGRRSAGRSARPSIGETPKTSRYSEPPVRATIGERPADPFMGKAEAWPANLGDRAKP